MARNFDMHLQKLDKLLEVHIFMAKKGQLTYPPQQVLLS